VNTIGFMTRAGGASSDGAGELAALRVEVKAMRRALEGLMRMAEETRKSLAAGEFELVDDALAVIAAEAESAAWTAEAIPHDAVVAVINGEHPLTALRVARGMTQEVLAKTAGYSKNYISQLERGRIITPETAERLAIALKTTPGYFEEAQK